MLSFRRGLERLRVGIYTQPATLTVVGLSLFFFSVQQIAGSIPLAHGYTFGEVFTLLFGLNGALLLKGCFWQPLTYMFLHGGWGHLILNLLVLYFFGKALERLLGSRRFLSIYFLGGIIAGFGWLGVTALMPLFPDIQGLTAWIPPEVRQLVESTFGLKIAAPMPSFDQAFCLGASGGVFSLLGAFSAVVPDAAVYGFFLLIPFKLKARTLAIILVISTLADALLIQSQVAYSAHLMGGVVGYVMGRLMRPRPALGEVKG